MVKFEIFAFTLLLSVASSVSLADQMGPAGDKFYEAAARFENACSLEACSEPYSRTVLYDQNQRLNNLSVEDSVSLKEIGKAQAQIWGDTILEGDYVSSGRTRLDLVTGYFENGRLIGYKIKYSEKAWNVSECAYDGKRESLDECQAGRISEDSYVSPDKMTYFTDEDRYATFSDFPVE